MSFDMDGPVLCVCVCVGVCGGVKMGNDNNQYTRLLTYLGVLSLYLHNGTRYSLGVGS